METNVQLMVVRKSFPSKFKTIRTKAALLILLGLLYFNIGQSQVIKQKATTKDHLFSLIGKERNNAGDTYFEVNQINVFDKKTNRQVQTISGLNLRFNQDARAPLAINKILIVQDVNFDGSPDIRLENWSTEVNHGFLIWLFDPTTSKYNRNASFEQISSLFAADDEKQEIHNSTLSNGKSIKGIYKVVNNVPVLQRAREIVFAKGGDCCETYAYYERSEKGLQKIKTYKSATPVMQLINKLDALTKFNNADSILYYFGGMTTIEHQPEVTEYGMPEGFVYTIYTGSLADISEKVTVTVAKDGKIKEVNLNTPITFWTLPFGVKYGMTIPELVKLNGKPINISGFETDQSGQVNWNGGALADKNLSVEIGYSGNIPQEFIGDNANIRSDNPKLKGLKLFVQRISISNKG